MKSNCSIRIMAACSMLLFLNFLQAASLTEMAVIKGKVINEKKEPVEFATAVLISPVTGEVVKGEVCNENGEFNINKIEKGEYVLSVSMVGYRKSETAKLVVDGKRSVIEQTIVLSEQVEALKAVEVVGKKEFIEQTADKIVIRPDASISSASENVYELLRKLPGVSIDNNDNISLKGMQGVRVMIDGKPTYLSASQLASWLKSMQGRDVEKIEIIENPSAGYDAEGNSGIINIKTNHSRAPGFNGTVNGGLSYGRKLGGNGGLNLNMNSGKFNVYGNYSTNHWAGWNTMEAVRRFTGTALKGSSQLVNNEGSYSGSSNNYKAGADYFVADRHVVSVMVRGNSGSNNEGMDNVTLFRDPNEQTDSSLVTLSNGNNKWKSTTYNLNYKWDIDTAGQSLLFDIDFARFGFNSFNKQEGDYFDAAGAEMSNNLLAITSQGNDIRIFTSKMDYTLPVNKQLNLEAGAKISAVNTESYIDMDGTMSQHDKYIFDEQIQAVYVNARYQQNKTSVQLGLRLENTLTSGNSVSTQQQSDTAYLQFFPSVFVQQQLTDKHSLNLRYSYRIGRPAYQHLNPFKWMVDPYTFNVGNPALKPQYTHTAGLSHNYRNRLITNLGVNYTNGLFTQVIGQNDEDRTVYQTMENLHNSLDLSLSETVQLQPLREWRLNGTLTGMYKSIRMEEGDKGLLSRFSVSGNLNNTFTLPWKMDLELSGRYQSEQLVSNIILRPRYSVDLGIQRRFFENNGTLKIAVSDLFNTNNGRAYARHNNVDIEVYNGWDSRRLNVSFSYRFGKDNFKTRANRTTSSGEEQGRSSING